MQYIETQDVDQAVCALKDGHYVSCDMLQNGKISGEFFASVELFNDCWLIHSPCPSDTKDTPNRFVPYPSENKKITFRIYSKEEKQKRARQFAQAQIEVALMDKFGYEKVVEVMNVIDKLGWEA